MSARETIAIACFNQADYLGDAITSALAQTRPAHEVIVVDDGSTDGTATVAGRFPGVVYQRQANGGLSAARNTGLHLATGDRILFLDADDVLLPGALRAAAATLERDRDLAFVYGGYREVAADRTPLHDHAPRRFDDPFAGLLTGNHIAMHGTVLYDIHRLRDAGGFDESLRACEDWDVYLRLARRFRIAAYRDVAAEYRRHGDAMTRDPARMIEAIRTVLERHGRQAGLTAAERDAARAGMDYMTGFYAEAAVGILRGALRRRDAAAAWRVVTTTTRHDPTFLLRVVRSALRRARGRRGAGQTAGDRASSG